MSAYNKVLSRKEVERVVAHIRTLKPLIKIIKTKDGDGSAMQTH
jgi:ribosomal protein S24E